MLFFVVDVSHLTTASLAVQWQIVITVGAYIAWRPFRWLSLFQSAFEVLFNVASFSSLQPRHVKIKHDIIQFVVLSLTRTLTVSNIHTSSSAKGRLAFRLANPRRVSFATDRPTFVDERGVLCSHIYESFVCWCINRISFGFALPACRKCLLFGVVAASFSCGARRRKLRFRRPHTY